MSDKPIYVAFASPKLEKNFDKLKEGKFEDKLMIINLILEWFSHKEYERKFGY